MGTRNVVISALLVLLTAAGGGAWWWLSRARLPAVVTTENAEAELVAAREAAEPGQPLRVALRLKARPGWHTYWRNPGDSGQPTSIEWRLPAGFAAGPILWPVPRRLPVGPLANYGYEDEVLLASDIRVPANAKNELRLAARARWLICNPQHCIPESAELELALPVARGGPGRWGRAFDAIELPRPAPAHWRLSARREGARVLLELAGAQEQAWLFLPYEEGKVQHAAPQPLEAAGAGLRLAIPLAAQPVGQFTRAAGILLDGRGRAFEIDVPIR